MSLLDLTSEKPRYGLERVLHRIWGTVLGHQEFGIHDDFFVVGGSGELVTPLLAAIQEEFGYQLAAARIEESPTISSMALLLRGSADPAMKRVLITMRRDSAKRSLICFPSIGGGVARYSPLARRMDGCRVYGVQSAGLQSGNRPDTSIEVMAARYVAEIESIGDLQPAVFLGFSMGGIIALEAAKEYAARNGYLPQVVVVDGPPCYTSLQDASLSFRTFVREVLLLDLDVDEDPVESWTADLDRVYDTAIAQGRLPRTFERSLLHRISGVYAANAQAAARYRPQPFAGPITLFRCVQADEELDDLGWSAYAQDVRLARLPGSHFAALEPETVEDFVHVLTALY